jgi:four helix bundle suffix protein
MDDKKEPLIPKHGGYRNLKSFQLAQLAYDLTVRFCNRFISSKSRTHDQMVQAARSGVQNIAEGSLASGTSKKTELKLTNVARESLGELRLDYEDFLRQRGLSVWEYANPLREELVGLRLGTVDEVAKWVQEVHLRTQIGSSEIAANAILLYLAIACRLLGKQIQTLAEMFEKEGGFTERLHRVRTAKRKRDDEGR